jgi:hypothetical protein
MSEFKLTQHGRDRASSRGLSPLMMQAVFSFGREVHTRGAVIYAVGNKEVTQAKASSEDISEIEGWHIVCSRQGEVITVYRNRDLRGLRPRHRTRSDRYLRLKFARAA